MNPYTELIQNSKCEFVKNSEFTPKISKTENRLFDIYEFNLSDPINIDERLILENSKLKVKLTHDSAEYSKDQHGMLLVMVHYDFAFVSMKSKLNRLTGKKKKFLAYGKTESFEDQLQTEASMTQMANVIKYKIPASFYAKGDSSLEAEFALTDKFISIYENSQFNDETCWPINLIIEYIPPGKGANRPKEDDGESHSMIEMITPATLQNIPISDQQNLTVQLSFDTSITDAYPGLDTSSSLAGTLIQQMCTLESSEDREFNYFWIDIMGLFEKTGTIFPMQYFLSKNHKEVTLIFNVRQVYEDSCYSLTCKKDPTVIDGTYYRVNETTGIDTKYCFGKEKTVGKSNPQCDNCNPLGTSNCNSKGKCKCSHPYTGENCDDCVNGYEISTQFSKPMR